MLLRIKDSETLICGSVSPNPKPYVKESVKIKEKMMQAGLKPNERKLIVSPKNGKWVSECDGNNIIIVALVADGYPERLGYAFIDEVRKGLSDITNYQDNTAKETEDHFENAFMNLMEKYNDPGKIDKTFLVGQKVDIALEKTQKVVNQALQNQQDLNKMDQSTANLLTMAKDFDNNADELRKIMYWRNMKLKMIVGLMGGAASMSIVLPLAQKIFM